MKKFTRRFLAFSLILLTGALAFDAKAQNGYIYIHEKVLDEVSSVDFPFTGTGSIGSFSLNDNPNQIATQDIGSSQNGRLWAVGGNNILYYRDLGSTSWVQTSVTNATHVSGGPTNTCFIITTGDVVESYNGTTATTIASATNFAGSGANNVSSGWNGNPYIVTNNNYLYRYSGTGTTWTQVSPAAVFYGAIDASPVTGNAVVSVSNGNVYIVTPTGVSTSIGVPAGGLPSDIAVDAAGYIYATGANSYVYKYLSGTTWDNGDPTTAGGANTGTINNVITAGVGSEVWVGAFRGTSAPYGNILTRAVSSNPPLEYNNGNTYFIDDERVRTAPSNQNSVMLSVAPGTYTISELVPAGWALQDISIFDSLNQSTANLANASVSITVTAGHTVNVIFQTGVVTTFQMTSSCTNSYTENFGTGAVGTFGGSLTGQTPYHYLNTSVTGLDGYYKVASSTCDFPSFGAACAYDHTTGNGTGQMMIVNAAYDKSEFFRRRFEGLIPGANYRFSAWLLNIDGAPIKPNVEFQVIDTATQTVIGSDSTGAINNDDIWYNYSLSFVATRNTVDLVLRNNAIGGSGNDLALDDITFALSPVITPVTTIISTGCNTLGSITVTAPLGSSYEYSINGGSYQLSPYFPNLPAGIYTITANFVGTTGCSTYETDTVRAAICGTVYHDSNGLTDSTVNGTGTNAGGVNIVLYDNTIHQVVSTEAVQNDGTYEIGGVYSVGGVPGDSLTLYLTTASVTLGQSAVPALTLPTGWIYTGEFLGLGAGHTGTNGVLPLGKVTTNLTNANFGINCSAIAGPAQTICQNGSVNTSATSTGTGTWSARAGNPATTSIASVNSGSTTITGFTASGIYYFYWSNGCTTDSLQVTVNPVPGSGITGPNVSIGYGSSTTLSATGGSSFLWSPSSTLSSATASNPIATPVATTTYDVTVTNVYGCSSVDSQKVTIVSLPNVSAGDDTFVCVGSSVRLNGSSTTPGATFQWFSTAINYLSSSTIANPIATPTVAGNYQYILRATYFSGGIFVSNYDTMYLTAYPVPQVTAAPSSVSVCNGTPVNVSFSSSVAFTTYTWTATNGTSGSGNISTNISNTGTRDSSITYTVVGTSPGGCKNTITVSAVVHPVPKLSATGFSKSICGGSNYTGTVTSSVPGATIAWTSTAGLNGSGGNVNVPINNSGTTPDTVIFSFIGTYSGCSSSALLDTVIVYPTVTANAGASQTYCLPISGTVKLGGNPSATGGSGNYSYAWSPKTNLIDSTIANPTVSAVATNTEYHLVVTDNVTGCKFTDSTHLTINTRAIVVISSPDTSVCVGQSTILQATGTPLGGSYQWSPLVSIAPPSGVGSTITVTPVSISAQSYQVVYNVNGCLDTAYQTVHAYSTVSAHADSASNHALTYCFPVSATVKLGGAPTATGGSGSFTYAWSPSTNLSDSASANPIVTISGPTTITYHLLVTDNSTHCTGSDSVVLTVNPTSTVSITLTDTNLCLGQSTTLSASGNPSGGSYQWSPQVAMTPSSGSAASVTVAPGATQTYNIVYTSSNCSASASVNVHIYPTVVAHGGGPKNFCPPINTVSLGAIPAATGGSGHYRYSWSPAATLSDSTLANPIATPLATTTYYLTVTDSVTGCISTDSVLVSRNPTPPAKTSPSASICFGGSATLTASGGVSFIWSNPSSLSNANSCCPLATPSSTTIYTVTVTDANGCTASASDTITVGSVLIFTIPTVSICQGDTGTLIPSLLGPNYKYTWTLEPGISCVSCATPLVYPTASSLYQLSIIDTVNGCSSGTDTAVVTVHANPVADFFTAEVCQGQVAQFTDISTSSDSINRWFYNFGDGTLTNDTSDLKNPTYIYQTYTAHNAYETVTTIYGCSNTVHISVSSYPPVVPYAGPDTCIPVGSSVTLNATGANHFSWTPDSTLSNPNISDPVADPLVTTTYKVVLTDGNGCSATDSVKVTVVALPNVSAGRDTFVCVGSSVPLSGSSSSPGATYHWTSSIAGTLNNPNIARPIATPTASGSYTFILTATVYDTVCGINVSNSDTMTLTVDPLPVITATPDSVVACGSPIIIAFGSTVASTTYKWTGSNGTSGVGNISTFINNTTTHDSSVVYTVVGTSPGGCTDTILVPAVIHPVPVLTASGFSSTVCAGAYYTGNVTSNISGTTIIWTSTLGLNGTGGNINEQINNFGTIADTVIFSFTGSKNGCSSAVLYDTVIVYPMLHADAGSNTTIVSCSSDSIQLGGFPTAYGGYPGYTYQWSPVTGGINPILSNPFIKNIGSNTVYTVTVTDSKGCTAVDSMKVTVQPPTLAVSISASGTTTWCEGTNGTVDLTVNISGGTPLYSFAWTPTLGLTDTTSQVATASPANAGTYPYTVVVTDRNGCQASATRTITVKPEPHPVITGLNPIYCANVVSVPLTASISGGTWSGPGVAGSAFHPSLFGPGTFTIVYTVTSGGCTNDTFQTVTVDSVPVVTISGNNGSYCSNDTPVVFSGSPAGGTWSGPGIDSTTGLFNPSLVTIPNNISKSITITYQYTTAGGCTASASVSITVNKLPTVSITMSADTICQHQSVTLTPHYSSAPLNTNIQWYNLNGTPIINTLNPITVNPTQENQGYYAIFATTQGCSISDTVFIHVNQSPYAAADYDTICGVTTDTINVLANDTDPENNAEVLSIIVGARHGKAHVSSNEIVYSQSYGYFGYDTLTYSICNAQCLNDCDTAKLYLSICPRNLPPTADTIRYTQLDSVPQDVNVILATSSPNGTPLTISLIGDSSHADSLIVVNTGNGSYTITGNDTGTFVIQYQVCDSSHYPVYVLCDSSVIIAHIVLPPDTITPQPPVANNDYATTTGTALAVVNVRGNDYTDPTSHGLTTPTLIGSTTTADGTWSVSGGMVIFQPKSGLAPGIYRDTIHYQVCDLVNGLCATAFVVVTTDEIDTPANRPPVAVNDHETVGENTTSSFNVKSNDSDPDGDSLTIPTIISGPSVGTIVSVTENGTVTYKSNTNLFSTNGQPIDSFEYYICDTLAAHPVWPLCDTAEVYIYVTPRNLPPTADTIVYTQLATVPQDVNVSLATSDPNGDPLNISLIGDSTDGHNLTVIKNGNGSYTITGNTIGTYVITYQVCDTDQYPVHVLCDTSFIIAHIVPPFDTLSPRPPVANNDFATTTGTTPATVNVRGNDYTNPTSHGLTTPVLTGSTTTADGTWSVNGSGQVVFQPNAGLAPGIYYDTIHYQVCDLVDVPQLCATAYVIVTTNEIDTPIYNRPPVAVNDHETVPMNTTSSFNVKANDSDPDGNPLTIPTIVSGDSTHNGAIVSIGDNGTIVYAPHNGVHSINGQPVDSFKYYICDSLAAHPVSPLCDSAEVYIYVVPQNLPPTADTIMYTQLDSVPQDVNVISATSSPNGTPLTISLVGDSSHNDSLTIINTGNGSYTITGNDTGTYVITYQVCDSSQYPIHVLCDTSVIIAHIIPPADTLTPQPPVANNDFATTSGTAPAVVNVRANDYSNPTSHGLTTPVLTGSTTTADGTWSVNGSGQVVFQPNAGLAPGIYYDTVHYQVCDLVDVPQLCATAYVVVTTDEIDTPIANRPPVAVNDHETIPMNTTSSFNVKANDSDPDGDSLSIPHIISGTGPHNGTIVSVADNGTIAYTPHNGVHSINGQPVDSFEYYICDTLAAHPVWPLCDTAEVYIYVTPQNLPPTADTIMYTQLDSVPQDVNVISATSAPNGLPLVISLIGDSSHNDSLTVINTGNGSYTIIGNDTGTYVITYQVCDSSQYPIHVLCDTSVIIAHIIPPADTLTPQPPVANNDFATTSGTAPAVVNVRANDYSNPTSHGLTTPVLTGSTTTADGTWSVNGSGQVVFQPKSGLTPGIYYDTVYYRVCDLVNGLCASAYVVVTTDEIDNPANRPPVAVNDHETIPMNTTSSFNVKANDSDPDGDSLSIPHIISGSGPHNGTIVSVGDNGTVVYEPNSNVESINNQPVDSFEYYICDTLAAHPVWPLCDTAEVYIYVTPRNLPPTADTIVYTQLVTIPQDVNVSLATSDPNGDPLNISLIGDSTDGGNLVVVKTGNGSYTITGNTIGTYVISYQVCDTDKYPIHVLCDTSVIIAHIVPPSDTLTPQPPVANNDFATTSGTTPATVNVLGNDYSNPTSHGLTTPVLTSSTTTADGTWTVNGSGQVVFRPNAGLAPGIYHDTVYYRVCDLVDIPQLCATAYVVVTTNEIDTPIANRPPVAVNDHETVPGNVPSSFNVKINDSDPDGDSLTIPTIVTGPVNGTIISISEIGTIVYQSDTNIHSTNSHTPIDSFRYSICDTLAAYPVRPLCDTAEVYIYVPQSLFAINDTSATSCSAPVVICVKNNDYDTQHDSFYVKGIVTPPAHGTATLDSTQCVTYTPNGYAASFPGGIVDSFRYYDQDLLGATDSAWVYVKVICCSVTANNDTFTTHYGDTIYGNILRNDLFNDSLAHSVTLLPGSGPTGGTVTVFDSIIIYIPHSGFCGTDNFKYILTGACGQDTASVHITVLCDSCRKPIAVSDSSFHGYSCKDTINVLANDTFGVGGAIVTVIKAPLYGTDTVINNNIVYTPDGTHPSTLDSLQYSLCNSCGQCDTATVWIQLLSYPCSVDHPVVNNVVDSICKNTNALINVLASDSDPAGQTLYISLVTNPAHGSAFNQGDTLILYHPDSSFVGVDTFAYQVCNTGAHLCNTAFVFVDVLPCLPPPIIVDTIIRDTTAACTAKTFCIDSIYQGAGYTVRFYGFCDSASHGSVLLSTDTVKADSTGQLCFTYTPNCDTTGGVAPYTGNDTFCLVICDTGHDTVCTVTHVIMTILPIPSDDTLTAHPTVTYICNQPDTVHVLLNDGLPTPGNPTTGTAIYVLDAGASAGKAPAHGTVSIGPGDSTVIYIPDSGYSGVDTFLYVITNNGLQQLFDTSIVYVYVCTPPHPIAVDDCSDTAKAYVNTPYTINILSNDTLFPANDTAIVIIDSATHGRLIVNPDFTVTYIPDSGFVGNDNFSYQVAEFVGSVIGYSNTASACIDVIDTIPTCFFPNGISPNGDGINDVFVFPCNDQYPDASLLIFNRWGDKIWEVDHGYKNDWGGTNLQGTPVPDGTYYFVYKYNDGTGRSVARFVVVYRGHK